MGYYLPDQPGVLVDTANGMTPATSSRSMIRVVSILGRARRFAKIAGEMVSLSAVESGVGFARSVVAVVSLPIHQGEELVLFTSTRAHLETVRRRCDPRAFRSERSQQSNHAHHSRCSVQETRSVALQQLAERAETPPLVRPRLRLANDLLAVSMQKTPLYS